MQNQAEHCECVKSELDLFKSENVQISQQAGRWVEHFPTSQVNDGGPVEFLIPGSEDMYIDLNSSYMRMYFQITKKDGTAVGTDDKVGPINHTMHSVFQQIDVFLNDKMITDGSPTYAYRAYLESLLSYGSEAKNTQLQGSLFYKDTPAQMEDVTQALNQGLKSRSALAKNGVEMFGRLHLDMFNQDRYLLNSVNVHIKCVKNTPEFVLMYDPSETDEAKKGYRYKLTDVCMVMRKVQLTSSVRLAHEKVLAKANAKYPISRVLTNVYSIPEGTRNLVRDDLFHGQIPSRIVVGMVKADAFNGTPSGNPYNFKHFDISSINFLVNDDAVAPMNVDFTKNQFASAYANLFHACHMFSNDWGNDISIDDFKSGSSLFLFENTPDLSDTKSLHRTGNTKLSIKFKSATDDVMCLVVLAQFDHTLQITKERAVIVDYST